MGEYKIKVIELNGDRKLQNACKKAGIELFNPQGAWNGYGYEKLPMCAKIKSLSEMRKFNQIKRELDGTAKKVLTPEEKMQKWAERLAKLTGISVEDALKIAHEKLDYKQSCIDELEDKQYEHYSTERAKLINKLSRENPLRAITDKEHAFAILAASHRHNDTDYEYQLEEAKELAQRGELDHEDVQMYARMRKHESN